MNYHQVVNIKIDIFINDILKKKKKIVEILIYIIFIYNFFFLIIRFTKKYINCSIYKTIF